MGKSVRQRADAHPSLLNMIWQDIVISIVQWTFVLTLLPSVFSSDKPALATSVLTGILLTTLAATFATIPLWNATVSSAAVGVVWFVLAYQKYRLNRQEKSRRMGEEPTEH